MTHRPVAEIYTEFLAHLHAHGTNLDKLAEFHRGAFGFDPREFDADIDAGPLLLICIDILDGWQHEFNVALPQGFRRTLLDAAYLTR